MLLELAIGDAYGAGFEYTSWEMVQRNNDLSGYRGRRSQEIKFTGRYTDDTQMSLAIAEAIVAGDDWTPENLADRFVDVFQRDPRGGYATQFQMFISETKSGTAFLENIRPDSDKSGAAMRATPIAVFPTVAEVIERATIQAKLTHNTPDGIAAACASALMPHYFLYNYGPKQELGIFLEAHVPGPAWNETWRGKVGPKGWMSVRAAITAVMQYNTLSEILKACVDFTGDVDTVATIALAAASCCPEVASDLPAVLRDNLENGFYGRDYLIGLDAKLMQKVS